MKITLHSSLAACTAALLLGIGLSGCSNGGGKVDLSHMSKDQQIQAVGQMDSQTKAIEDKMRQSLMASKPQPGAKPGPPQAASPAAGQQ